MRVLLKGKNLLVLFLFLWYTKCFSWLGFPFDDVIYGWISHVFEAIILCYVLINHKRIVNNSNIHFSLLIILLAIIPFLSTLSTVLYNDQLISKYIIRLSYRFLLLFYFVLHILKISRKDILQISFLLGGLFITIKILQQITYPNLLFYSRDFNENTNEMEIRNNFYRILIAGSGIFYISFYNRFEAIFQRFKIINLIYILFGIIAIYLELGRMKYVMSIITLFIIYISKTKSSRILSIAILIAAVIIVANYFFSYFSEFISMTQEDLNNEDYVRWLSYSYYWKESIKNIPLFLLGNGISVTGEYAKNMETLQSNGLWVADIGVVGELFHFGAIYVLTIIFFAYKVISASIQCNRKYIFAYLVPIFLFSIIMSPFHNHEHLFIWSIITYLIDLELLDSGIYGTPDLRQKVTFVSFPQIRATK